MNDSTFMLPENELETIAQQYRFADGKISNIGKNIYNFKLGSEYASGGAGCISTVDDSMKFLEGLRTYKLLKPETVKLMMTNRLTEEQICSYWERRHHGYGLGVRCPKGVEKCVDFGWGGAACAFLAIDLQNNISVYFGGHLISSPAHGVRCLLYRFVRAELVDNGGFEELYQLMKELYGCDVTY